MKPGPALACTACVMISSISTARAERTIESAERDCAQLSKKGPDGDSRKLVPARPAVLATAALGGMFGAGFRGGLAASSPDPAAHAYGLGWTARARVDFALLSPLWISGAVGYGSVDESTSWNVDAIVGWNVRTLGAHSGAISGDYRTASGARATAGFCNYQRADLTLFAGVRTLIFASTPRPDAPSGSLAMQAGVQRYFFNDGGGKAFWSAAALYDPSARSYGAQGSAFAGLGDWPIGIGFTVGALAGGDHNGFWFTADLGTLQQF